MRIESIKHEDNEFSNIFDDFMKLEQWKKSSKSSIFGFRYSSKS